MKIFFIFAFLFVALMNMTTSQVLISSCTALQNISQSSNSNYSLTMDIDCSNISFSPITGTFGGVLEGNGHKIMFLNISSTSNNESHVQTGCRYEKVLEDNILYCPSAA